MILLMYGLMLCLTILSAIITFRQAGKQKWLSGFCCCNGLYQVLIIFDAMSVNITPSLYLVLLTLLFTPGPVLLALTGTGLSKKLISQRDFFALLIPGLAVMVCSELLAPSDTLLSGDWTHSARYTLFLSLFQFIALVSIFHTLSYVSFALHQLHKNKHSWRVGRSTADIPRQAFISLLILFCLMAIAQVFSAYAHPDGMAVSYGDMAAMLWCGILNTTILSYSFKRLTAHRRSTPLSHPHSTNVTSEHTQNTTEEHFVQKLRLKLEQGYINPEYSTLHMASELNLSPRQLQRKMQLHLGMSPKDYLKQFRLEKAKNLLASQNTQVATVAYSVGFSSPAYFGACFKQQFNQTPLRYQKARTIG